MLRILSESRSLVFKLSLVVKVYHDNILVLFFYYISLTNRKLKFHRYLTFINITVVSSKHEFGQTIWWMLRGVIIDMKTGSLPEMLAALVWLHLVRSEQVSRLIV